MPASFGHMCLKAVLAGLHGHRLSKAMAAAGAPSEVQTAVLKRILAANQETTIGRRYRFARVDSISTYRRTVPVHTYEDLRDDIDAQELANEPRLTREPPVYYNRTSGTVGEPKNIPLTRSGLLRMQTCQKLGAYCLSRGSPVLSGKIYAVAGAAVEGRMPGGTPFGSASGLIYQNQPSLLRSRYVLPSELASITDYDERYVAMAAFGIAEPRVTVAATPNSSTLNRLLQVINEHAEELLRALAEGRMPAGTAMRTAPKRNPQRAARLRAKLDVSDKLTYADIWPRLAGVVTWTGGSCGLALRNLEPSLPADCRIIEMGYIASEVQGTLNVDPRRNRCLPTLQDTFFEFAERDDWEAGGEDTLGLAELEDGRDYYVIVTTSDGLYRYDMNDIVRVSGWINETPTLTFVQKGKGATSITGEKLYEA